MKMSSLVLPGAFLALAACGGGDEGPEAQGAEAPEALVESCQRMCGLSLPTECEPGQLAQHGKLLEEGSMPPGEAPTSNDEDCMDFCTDPMTLESYACWQHLAAENDCLANGVWHCDAGGGWSSPSCGDLSSACPG